MARLAERSAAAGLLPREIGRVRLSEVESGPVFTVAPFRGREGAAGDALGGLGLSMPGPGEVIVAEGGARATWVAPGRALVFGRPPEGLAGQAAVTDQTGAQVVVRIEGPGEAVLARLCPVDLREAALGEGRTVRTLLGHMTVSVSRIGGALEVMPSATRIVAV